MEQREIKKSVQLSFFPGGETTVVKDKYRRKLSGDEINQLPTLAYKGKIHFIKTSDAINKAVQKLACESLLGFDIESRPAFRKGEYYPPALLQLAGKNAVYLFHLASIGLTGQLVSILSNRHIIKSGVAVGRDIKDLRTLQMFEPRGFVDIGKHSEKLGLAHHGLRGLAALLLDGRVSKSGRFTNWSLPDLSEKALGYAATDAWLGRRLYERLKEITNLQVL